MLKNGKNEKIRVPTSPDANEQMWILKSARRGIVSSFENPKLHGARAKGGIRSHAGRGGVLLLAILKGFGRGTERKEEKMKGDTEKKKGFFPFYKTKSVIEQISRDGSILLKVSDQSSEVPKVTCSS